MKLILRIRFYNRRTTWTNFSFLEFGTWGCVERKMTKVDTPFGEINWRGIFHSREMGGWVLVAELLGRGAPKQSPKKALIPRRSRVWQEGSAIVAKTAPCRSLGCHSFSCKGEYLTTDFKSFFIFLMGEFGQSCYVLWFCSYFQSCKNVFEQMVLFSLKYLMTVEPTCSIYSVRWIWILVERRSVQG